MRVAALFEAVVRSDRCDGKATAILVTAGSLLPAHPAAPLGAALVRFTSRHLSTKVWAKKILPLKL